MPTTTTDQEEPPRQVSEQPVTFLDAIGRTGPLAFRAIMDAKNRKGAGAQQISGTFAEVMQQLRRSNDAGYGIFVTVNATDGQGVSAANIVAATCFFVDFDGTPLDHVARLGLKPHVAVDTSPGKRHFYWRVNGITLTEFSAVQKRLIALFGSDKSVHDLPRMMRLPGFLHQKNPDAPTLVTCEAAEGLEPYPIEIFLAAGSGVEGPWRCHARAQDQRREGGCLGSAQAGQGRAGAGRISLTPSYR